MRGLSLEDGSEEGRGVPVVGARLSTLEASVTSRLFVNLGCLRQGRGVDTGVRGLEGDRGMGGCMLGKTVAEMGHARTTSEGKRSANAVGCNGLLYTATRCVRPT